MALNISQLSVSQGLSDIDTCRAVVSQLSGAATAMLPPSMYIVEGTLTSPIIGIEYPGKKVKRRKLIRPLKTSALWKNLFDFAVIPFENGVALGARDFSFADLLGDFDAHKKGDQQFWNMLQCLYKNNSIIGNPPQLNGIESMRFLLTVKWIWIQEDLNYRYSSVDVNSPIKYSQENDAGQSVKGGSGRAKFFAALLLLHEGFPLKQVTKIIPPYG